MKLIKQFMSGILAALFSMTIIFSGFTLALADQIASLQPTITGSIPALTGLSPNATDYLPTSTFTNTASPLPPTTCPPPVNWFPITVENGDTLAGFALLYQTTIDELIRANCLFGIDLIPGSILYVPQPPEIVMTATSTLTRKPDIGKTNTQISCGPPSGWIIYIVQSGDTLYQISQAYNTTVAQLQIANCLGDSTLIKTGQRLYVPNVVPKTPTFTLTPTSKPTKIIPTNTPIPPSSTPVPPSNTPPTPEPTATPTETETPTNTQEPTVEPTSP